VTKYADDTVTAGLLKDDDALLGQYLRICCLIMAVPDRHSHFCTVHCGLFSPGGSG